MENNNIFENEQNKSVSDVDAVSENTAESLNETVSDKNCAEDTAAEEIITDNTTANADSKSVYSETAGSVAEIPSASESGFEKYRSASPSFTSVPNNESSNSVYIGSTGRKAKSSRTRLNLGTAAALVAVCMVFSGVTAFGGTLLANKLTDNTAGGAGATDKLNAGTPSIVLQSYSNENRTAGTYVDVATAVSPTVVEITTESIVTDSIFWGGNYVTSGAGSGVIISSDGTIITNNHVVSGASAVTVRLKDGTEYAATVVGADSDSDIAVIKIEASELPFALIGDSDTLKIGEEVLAVGNPLGKLGGTVTNGIVSALSRDISIDGTEMTLIQTNAAVNPGNSGGGLFNMYGELIGIVNAKSSTTSSGTSVEGIGFAIPSNTAVKVATELTNYGYVRGRVMLGINYIDIDSSYKAMYYRVSALGVYVAASPYNDELKVGDRIVAVDGSEVTYGADVKAAIKDRAVGDEISVTVVRDGKYIEVNIVLREYVPTEVAENDSADFEDNFEEGTETEAPAANMDPFFGFEDFFFGW